MITATASRAFRGAACAVVLTALAPPVAAAPGTLVFGSDQDERLVVAAPADAGAVYVAGVEAGYAFAPGTPWIARLGADGTEAWRLGLPASQPRLAIGAAANGDALLVAVPEVAVAPRPLSVLRLAPDGVVAWQRTFEVAWAGPPLAESIVEAADGSIWLGLVADVTVVVMRLDADGTPTWALPMRHWARTEDRQPLLAPLPGGDVAVAFGDDAWLRLLRVTPTGAIAWGLEIDREPFRGPDLAALGSAADRLVLVGTRSSSSREERPRQFVADVGLDGTWRGARDVLATLDPIGRPAVLPDGSVTWSQSMADGLVVGRLAPDRSRVDAVRFAVPPVAEWSAVVHRDGRVALAGVREGEGAPGLGGQDGWMLELDASGALPAGCAVAAPADVPVAWNATGARATTLTWATSAASDVPFAFAPTPMPGRVLVECGVRACAADVTEAASCGVARLDLARGAASLNFCDDAEDHVELGSCAGVVHEVSTVDLGPLADTVLEAWTSDCATLLASDDDGGGGLASRVAFTMPADGLARLVVRQKDGLSGPGRDYGLSLARPECPVSWVRRLAIDGSPMLGTTGFLDADGTVVVASPDAVARLDGAGEVTWAVDDDHGTWWETVRPDPFRGGMVLTGPCRGTDEWCVGWLAPDARFAELRRVGGPSSTVVSGAMPVPGGVVAWGYTSPDGAWVARIDGDRVTWEAGLGVLEIPVVVPMPDGGALVALQRMDDPPPLPWIARLDSAGGVTWQGELDTGLPRAMVRGGASFGTGMLLGLEVLDAAGTVPVSLALVAVDESGVATPERHVAPWHQLHVVEACPGGGAVVTGMTDSWTGVSLGLALDGSTTFARERDVAAWEAACGAGGSVLFESDALGWESRAWRLDAAGQGPGACDPSRAVSLSDLPMAGAVLRPASVVPTTPGLVVERLFPALRPVAVTSELACSTLPCEPMDVSVLRPVPDPPCESGVTRLEAVITGGTAPVVAWDLDYDGTFDAQAHGVTADVVFPAPGPRRVAARVTDACPWRVPEIRVIDVDVRAGVGGAPAITGRTVRCAGEPCVTLSATPGFATYRWTTGEASESICVAPAARTHYQVLVTDGAGCSWRAGHDVDVADPPSVSISESCEGGRTRLVATVSGRLPPFAFEWDTGETTDSILVDDGTHDVRVTSADGCTVTASLVTSFDCAAPSEVGGPGAPALLVTGADVTTLLFAPAARARDYNVLVGAIGDFTSPRPADSACHVQPLPAPGGLLWTERILPPGSWLVVTASNRVGEGPAGASSLGVERSASPAWNGCGASP